MIRSVSASLAAIALIALAIGADVLFADNMSRDNTIHFNECKAWMISRQMNV